MTVMRIAVAGGTGTIGHWIVEGARSRGHEVVVLSRAAGVDLTTGAGVAPALAGCDVIVDAANTTAQGGRAAERFFATTAQTLHRHGRRAGAGRLIAMSIVGLEEAQGALPYYRAKLAHEDAHRRGGLPVTVVRSTQFHDFPGQLLARMSLGPIAAMPRMRIQPVDSAFVAGVVLDAVEAAEPAALLHVGGPQPEDLVDLARQVRAHRGQPPRILGLPLPGAGGRAVRAGALLPRSDAILGGPTFTQWLVAGTTR